MEASASAPTHPEIELEPPEWQPRATWVAARLLCGAAAFFFISFVFAYFYLRSQDTNRDWKIGAVHPSVALGVAIVVVLVLSAAALQAATRRHEVTVRAGSVALLLALLSVALQVIDWTTLGFGPASGGYASVFVGWTAFYAVFTLACIFWIETQVATFWRRARQGAPATPAEVLSDTAQARAGLEACSFFWTFYVASGVVLFVLLYLVWSVGRWTIGPALAYVATAAMLYYVGGRGYSRARSEPRRTVAFAAGLATIVLALDSPIDAYADQLFWVHMLQHVLLLTVAPPLILLGRPWPRMWRALPVQSRRTIARTLARSRWTAPVRVVARPWPAWLLFNVTFVAWHVPVAYDLTLRSPAVHDAEHAMFFFTGLLFWARVIDPGPLRPSLQWPVRIAYVVGAMIVGWVLAITLVLLREPLYTPYALVVHRPGGITALTDQQLAAGMMWVPGSISYTITVLIGIYRWLEPDREPRSRRAALTI